MGRLSEAVNGGTQSGLRGRRKNIWAQARKKINSISYSTKSKYLLEVSELDVDLVDIFKGAFRSEKKRTMTHVVMTLKTAVKNQLRGQWPRAFREENINKKGYSDTLADAIVAGKVKGDEFLTTNINILGNREGSSGTYRLRFFEEPIEREKRGKIGEGPIAPNSRHFFKNAIDSVDIRQLVENHMKTYFN